MHSEQNPEECDASKAKWPYKSWVHKTLKLKNYPCSASKT